MFILFVFRTPLHYASRRNQALAARFLLNDGADPHAFDKNGYTPLHSACECGAIDFIKVLFEFKANSKICFRRGVLFCYSLGSYTYCCSISTIRNYSTSL